MDIPTQVSHRQQENLRTRIITTTRKTFGLGEETVCIEEPADLYNIQPIREDIQLKTLEQVLADYQIYLISHQDHSLTTKSLLEKKQRLEKLLAITKNQPDLLQHWDRQALVQRYQDTTREIINQLQQELREAS